MVGYAPTMVVTANGESGFNSGEGAGKTATTSMEGSRRANYQLPNIMDKLRTDFSKFTMAVRSTPVSIIIITILISLKLKHNSKYTHLTNREAEA
jgi:hypothetical protein